MASLDSIQFILPKKKQKTGGQSATPGYNANDEVRSVPRYANHRNDIFDSRQSGDSRTLLDDLVRHDPDVSSAIFAFGTISSSAQMYMVAYDTNNEVDADGIKLAQAISNRLFTANDYSIGFNAKMSEKQFLDDLRYSTILHGAYGFELVYDKALEPYELRIVDMKSVEWQESKPGLYKPFQKVTGVNDSVSLDIPTFFTEKFHQNPNDIYGYSLFVSAINTIAARQQVINDLYRIMQFTGYPRLDITVLESVLMQNAPPALRNDPKKRQQFVDQQLSAIRGQFTTIRPDQAFVHTDAVKTGMVNDKNPGASLQIKEVIETLNAQNQAALKTMPSVVGKGQNGDTASTESRLFAISCDSLNKTLASGLSEALTLAARIAGFQGRVEVCFTPIELRPTLELEPHFTMKASRLKQDLSLGVITDLEYHMQMYNRPPPAGYKKLSGTNFLDQQTVDVQADKISPNDDPNGRGQVSEGGKNAKSNRTKSGEV
jgi:hypothetical protein